jgi:ABC-type transport system involved in cytochrome c biogenesis permease subunit
MKAAVRYVPWAVVAVGVFYLVGAMTPRSDPKGEMKLKAFASLPVQDGGRFKPIDTYARVQLMLLNNRQDYTDEKGESGQPAVRWLLNVLADGMMQRESMLPVVNPEVRQWLGLPDGRRWYTYREIFEALKGKDAAVERLLKTPEDKRTDAEKQIYLTLEGTMSLKASADAFRKAQKELGNPRELRIFRIENDQVRSMLGLPAREGLRYSFAEITGNWDRRGEENADQAMRFLQFYRKSEQARKRDEKQRDIVDRKAMELAGHIRIFAGLEHLDGMAVVPPSSGEKWQTLEEGIYGGDKRTPEAAELEGIIRAYAHNDVKEFNKAVDAYQKRVVEKMPNEAGMVRLEVWFNQFSPFYRCIALYVLVFLLACLSWVVWPEMLRRSAFYLGIAVVIVHTFALCLRMYIQGRPPVTNLYSSAVFIGWGCVLLCLAIEWWYRNGIGVAVAAGLGFSTLIIAHHLGGGGDTMEMLQAVLDTNFWLATHVTTVTLGYAATFGAGFLGAAYLWRVLATTVVAFYRNRNQPGWTNGFAFSAALAGVVAIPAVVLLVLLGGLSYVFFPDDAQGLTWMLAIPIFVGAAVYAVVLGLQWTSAPAGAAVQELPSEARWLDKVVLTQSASKTLAGVVYGVVCFATMLSFIGTVLGGIWADQSWGRFWGWDPKENGAILIVIMNALILHARWGGMIKERGLVALTIVGNMVTMWSWFGTNQLGIGLHAYGFNNALVKMCTYFWFTQFGVLFAALLPLRYWRSYSALEPIKPEKTPAPKPSPRTGGRGSTGIMPAH